MSIDKSASTITTRYRKDQMDVYKGVMDLVKDHTPNLSKSLAQFLLVEKGLKHIDNPTPLVIPKPKVVVKKEVVYKDRPVEKIVYKDRPVEKVVYKDRPEQEHLTDRIVDISITGKPKSIQSVDKVTQQETSTSTGSGWIWLLGGLIAVISGWKIASLYTQKNGNNSVPVDII